MYKTRIILFVIASIICTSDGFATIKKKQRSKKGKLTQKVSSKYKTKLNIDDNAYDDLKKQKERRDCCKAAGCFCLLVGLLTSRLFIP